MVIGVPKEIKDSECRAGLTDKNVQTLAARGHQMLVQSGAGLGSLISDSQYEKAGAVLAESLQEVYEKADLIVKVKEPLPEEYSLFRSGQILFAFLHLAAEPDLAEALCSKGVKALACESIESEFGELPLLKPMSHVAGRLALQNGAYYLQKHLGGRGVLAGGAAGAEKARAVILGGGEAGAQAALMAAGLQARVLILDINPRRLKLLDRFFEENVRGSVQTRLSSPENLAAAVKEADLLIGSAMLKGRKAPRLITESMVKSMPEGSVFADIAIDQGGCGETSRPTSHKDPVYQSHQTLHYCVPNIPSAVPRTSTFALTAASFPYIEAIAEKGLERAVKEDKALKKGLNVYKGHVVCPPVAEELKKECPPLKALGL